MELNHNWDWLIEPPSSKTTEETRRVATRVGGVITVMRVPPGMPYAPTVPRFLRTVVRLEEPIWKASLYHDVLYKYQGDLSNSRSAVWQLRNGIWANRTVTDREFADQLFCSILKTEGVDMMRRSTMYYVLRLSGAPAWIEEDDTSDLP